MERLPVQSTEIALIGYDAQKLLLEITFRRGGVYRYRGIPPEIYQKLMDAPSIGTYFSENIKEVYEFVKVA